MGAVPTFFAGVWLDGSAERRSLVRIHAGRRCRGRRRAARRQRSGQPRSGAGRGGCDCEEEAVEVAERAHELACKQLVELVADYLDDALGR